MARSSSLERRFIILAAIPLGTLLVLLLAIGVYLQLDTLSQVTLLLLVLGPCIWALCSLYQTVFDAFDSVAVQLDSLANEEFTVWHFARYRHGRIYALKEDLRRIATRISNKRAEYAHHESFVFDLVNELHSPVVVLDGHAQVYHANPAALAHYHQDSLLGVATKELGLYRYQHQWQLHQGQHQPRYKIDCHNLKRGARHYQLLVYVSIEQPLRSTEKEAWQKLVKVLNHEVRNSLTPIYSLTQSLREQQQAHSLQAQMLEVIEKRAQHLLNFVASYSKLSQLPQPQLQAIPITELVSRLQVLLPHIDIDCQSHSGRLLIDPEQLEQALLNLVRNAEQANTLSGTEGIRLAISKHNQWQLKLYDNGPGIDNPDNLFVPFYSTKTQGTGIGLVLSREIIRAQGGELTLTNHSQGGALAQICLPKAK
ncbi:Sensor protein ZraS (plasmid) [Pseudoalteromonas sp. THAF3]|uniref:sensor histidine kinase n=1 Tax=Pseudoalteromonas sp. THAF3 TaxID=2587843 RepID=UPI0012684E04|nr:ATP-binding protein [Pseudoalteromonas sp. THAF3]QFU06874.1 Sensor protein ZraS [Pseudoalteromonas sp. THAF3]